MRTECNPVSLRFARLKGRDVVADFGGGSMTSDAGALLLGATDRAIGLVDRFSGCFSDARSADRVVHEVGTLACVRDRAAACRIVGNPVRRVVEIVMRVGKDGL